MHDKELETARADQAKARGTVMQKEKAIKKAEKALDSKVCVAANATSTYCLPYTCSAQT